MLYTYDNPALPFPPKAKSMTIAVSFQCANGIVMAADRLFTHTNGSYQGAFGSYDKKVFSAEGWNFAALITGSGHKDWL